MAHTPTFQMQPQEMTILLERASGGDSGASAKLMELVYDQLRALAGSYAGGRDANHTLQPTALVHEAFIKLVQSPGARFNDRAHFFAVAATAMRQILMDNARRKRAAKRGGDARNLGQPEDWDRITMAGVDPSSRETDIVALDDVLSELARHDQRMYRIVELRFFGGLEVEDTARLLGVSKSTVEADWRAARAWLAAKLRMSPRRDETRPPRPAACSPK